MIRQNVGVALAALLLLAASAHAQDDEEYGGDGSYLHLGFSGGLEVGGGSNEFLPGMGAKVGGYASPHFAFEVAWDWGNGDMGYNVGSFNIKVLPVKGRLQPYATAGFGFSVADGQKVYPIYRAGAGLEYYVTESWKIAFDGVYTRDIPSEGGLEVVTFGAMIGYHFY